MAVKRSLLFITLCLLWASNHLSAQGQKGFSDSLTAALEGSYPNIDELLISQNGKVLYERYFNGFSSLRPHDSRSSFKSITSLFIGIALDKKFVNNVHGKVYDYFPEYKPYHHWSSRKDSMTIRDLLEMKSGFDCEEWSGSKDCETAMSATHDWIRFSLDLPLVYTPGTHWAYTSSNALLLGGIVARASKRSVSEFARQFLFEPLDIKTYHWTKDPAGHEMTAGSFYILPADMLKIGELVLNKGTWKGRRIVSNGG